MVQRDSKRKKETLTLVLVFVLVLGVSALVVYLVAAKKAENEAGLRSTPPASSITTTPEDRSTAAPSTSNETVFDQIFGVRGVENNVARNESRLETAVAITLRLILAALLGAALAYRPRKRLSALKRNPYVGQTQILLALVAAALMIIVGDNAARAFGIFAAVSVVRFRTNIRDPKEITVLLISLAVGLGSGVGRWDLALILTALALLVLWVLEQREAEQVSRAMELTVTSSDVAATQMILRQILKAHEFDTEIRGINRETSDQPLGSLTYLVDVSPVVSTDDISSEILSLDSSHVASIEWKQKKSFSYMYQ